MFVIQTVNSGLGFYNMSVYMNALAKLLAEPVASVSFAVSLFFLAVGLGGMYVARLIERFEIRWIMVWGALGCAVVLFLVRYAESLWQVYVLFAVFGALNTSVALVVATTLITQWFPGPNRSIALSISSAGLSFGGVVITPATAYLFNDIGLPAAMPYLAGLFVLVIAPIAVLVVRPAPAELIAHEAQKGGAWTYRSAITTRFFILLNIGYILCMAAQVGGIAHLYSQVELLSDYRVAARAVQVLTICSIVGRIAGGFIVTRLSIRWYTHFNLVLQAFGLYLIGTATDANGAITGAALFGLSMGNLLMSQPLWIAEAFPGAVYPRVFALASGLTVLGVGGGPFLLGLSFDLAGYTFAYLFAVGLSAVALVFIYFAGARPATTEGTR